MGSILYNQINYKSSKDHIISEYIREYDISKANISVLREANKISEEQYNFYMNTDKLTRSIDIMAMAKKDSSIITALKKGIIEAKKKFFEQNFIEDEDVLQIRNDAVFILNKKPKHTQFGLVNFKFKNEFTSFYKTSKLEFFYYQDQRLNIENLSITGINDRTLKDRVFPLHRNFFIEFLLTVFDTAQNCSIDVVIDMITTFYNKYINRELDLGYYREFNSDSLFKFVDMGILKSESYKVEQASLSQLKYIDIENNRLILQELFKIFSRIKTIGG